MELPAAVPVMTLPSATLFPQALLPLYIFEPRYRQMLADMLRTDRMFSVAMQKPGRHQESPCQIAGLGLIRVSVGHNDGTSHLILQGLTRVELGRTVQTQPYRVTRIRPLHPMASDPAAIDKLRARVYQLVEERIRVGPSPFPFSALKNVAAFQEKALSATGELAPKDILEYLESLQDADSVADLVSCALLPGAIERQTVLETVDLEARLRLVTHFLTEEIRRARKEDGS